MARPTRLNDKKSEVIEQNHLLENFDKDLGIPTDEEPVIVATSIPEMREITFINNRDPGVPLYFHYHSKSHPLKHYTLMHGMKYTLPLEVVRHLEGDNKIDPWSCHTRRYSRRMRDDGVSETYASAYVPNFQCREVRA